LFKIEKEVYTTIQFEWQLECLSELRSDLFRIAWISKYHNHFCVIESMVLCKVFGLSACGDPLIQPDVIAHEIIAFTDVEYGHH